MTHMKQLAGISGSPGIAKGRVVFYQKQENSGQQKDLNAAREACQVMVRAMYAKALKEVGKEEAKIFSAYEMLLQDEVFFKPMQERIAQGEDPVQAVKEEAEKMSRVLASKKSEYMRQRADDIRYIGELLIHVMKGVDTTFRLPEGEDLLIIAARELTPIDTMQLDTSRLGGLVTELGGVTSHTVILAKSLGIPAVVGISDIETHAAHASYGLLNGDTGEWILDPDAPTLALYEEKLKEQQILQERIRQLHHREARTQDQTRISVCVNIGAPEDLKVVEQVQYDGVGLFRSEFLYLSKSQKPSLQIQQKAYQQAIDTAYPNIVTIRTLDVGGDKEIPYLQMPKEENPFLGNRGIRLCLGHEALFKEQLTAILTAAAGRPVKIMLPMVTSIREIQKTREWIGEVGGELEEQGIPYTKDAKLGIMIETPASAILADTFAKHCDFFSIGTNDLTQYILSADRGNSRIQDLYDPFHPAVLTMIAKVIQAGADRGIAVSICGDLAADTRFTKFLLGAGLRVFSVPAPLVGKLKMVIGEISIQEAMQLTKKALAAETAEEIKQIL